MIGKRFDKLTVNKLINGNIKGNLRWECTCDCGNVTIVKTVDLNSKHVRSCGCLHKESIRNNLENIEGRCFNSLIVKQYVYTEGNKRYWNCICECGNKKVVHTADLKSGHVKSCGCQKKNGFMIRNKNNKYGLKHGYSRTPTYRIWNDMKRKCKIGDTKISDSWSESFLVFLNDIGFRPSDKHRLVRKDRKRGFNIENCIWKLQKSN